MMQINHYKKYKLKSVKLTDFFILIIQGLNQEPF